MTEEFDEPELAGYQPHERPLRSPHLATVMRVVVIVGFAALLLPGILIGVSTASRTANTTCEAFTAYYAPESVSYSARFELVGPAGAGWNCYAVAFGGEELLLRTMGLIPGAAVPPRR